MKFILENGKKQIVADQPWTIKTMRLVQTSAMRGEWWPPWIPHNYFKAFNRKNQFLYIIVTR